MKNRLFITGIDTDIGKSFVTAALIREAKVLKQNVMAYKPVITGFDAAKIEKSDTGLLLRSLGLPPTPENIERISPWRFAAPLAPSMAARQENRCVDFDALTAHSRKAIDGSEDIVLIEGAGGVMVPLDERHTMLDWMAALNIPALLVAGTYLGALSHTLTALEVLKQRKIPVSAVIVNESKQSSVSLAATAGELNRWTDISIVSIGRKKSGSYPENLLAFQEFLI
ncbi:MAG: dethiobiotin synthase [Alphaproteobacteria bacterium]|nr:dethiobiotin synthase [Alphaproteobacteria bacterium]